MENLKRVKQDMIQWAKLKRLRDKEDLKSIEVELEIMEVVEEGGYDSEEAKNRIIELEKRKRRILLDQEEQLRLKSRDVWIKSGDENWGVLKNILRKLLR